VGISWELSSVPQAVVGKPDVKQIQYNHEKIIKKKNPSYT